MTKEHVETILKKLPEVTWDRWMGELGDNVADPDDEDVQLGIGIFGWLARADGKSDFVYLRLDHDGCWLIATSSAKYSEDFATRLNFKSHSVCKAVRPSNRLGL